MKTLPSITASAEQLPIISTNRNGAELIRGAAGSGKTTTALLRLSSLLSMMLVRKARMEDETPLKVLLLTFNRTLAGYVGALAEEQFVETDQTIEISTFASWAIQKLGRPDVHPDECSRELEALCYRFEGLDSKYLISEVEYLLGRFKPEDLTNYITTERTGRGLLPRVTAEIRQRILDEVVYPYRQTLADNDWTDWNTLATRMLNIQSTDYDIIVVDESQDFSANEIRAIVHHLSDYHSVTFVTDTAQRIYARGYTWVEAGVHIAAGRSHKLNQNHRNTKQIAGFASGILDGMRVDADGSLPNLDAATENGSLPQIITGTYSEQINWAINYINQNVDLETESVAFLKPQGGRWFDFTRTKLKEAGIDYAYLTRRSDWPTGDENVGLSTFHSAKGLEFDHVIILGYNQENTQFGDENESDRIRVQRRMLAVAVARARKHVVIGYKPSEKSQLTRFFNDNTFDLVEL